MKLLFLQAMNKTLFSIMLLFFALHTAVAQRKISTNEGEKYVVGVSDYKGEKIALLIRGLSPYPAAWTPLFDAEGGECGSIKIFKAQFVAGGNLAVGEIKADTRTLEIGCADGRLSILELQMAGKRRMGVEDFLRGVRDMERYCAEQK